MSALISKADIKAVARDVRSVPKADIAGYSITSSARARSVGRHRDAKRAGGLHIDHKFERGRLLHRHVGRLFALENAPRIDADQPVTLHIAGTVAHEPARFDEVAQRRDRRHPVARRKVASWIRRLLNSGSALTTSASARFSNR